MAKSGARTVTDQQIIESYRKTLSVFKTARGLGIGSTTAHRVLTKHNEPRPGLEAWRRNAMKFRGQEQDIRAAYESGMTMAQLSERFGEATHYAFKSAIKRAGGRLRDNPVPLIKDGELEAIKTMNAKGMGQVEISLALGRSQSFVSRVMRKNRISVQRVKGETHPHWKGGRYISGGYVRVWIDPNDPMAEMALNDGHILEHRLVMARKFGRPLRKTETVHHIDGDRTNNDPANLELRQGKHGKHVVMCCLDCGSRNVGHVSLSH